MILIADSGSTKTDWCVVENGHAIRQIKTKGTNPFFQSENEIREEIGMGLMPHLSSCHFEEIHFYGAGCAFPDKIESVRRAIAAFLEVEREIEVNTDMLAAARSLCGRQPGIACIMGTGSNSCFYDGKEIATNISPLGFILGDEGSGAVLGKLLVGNILKNQLPVGMKELFLERFALTPAEIIDRVYRQPFPNRFLASLSPFLSENISVPEVRQLVTDSFRSFLKRNVMQYDYQCHSVHFIGSIAFYYKEVLTEAAQEMDILIGKILESPMKGLIDYHQQAIPKK